MLYSLPSTVILSNVGTHDLFYTSFHQIYWTLKLNFFLVIPVETDEMMCLAANSPMNLQYTQTFVYLDPITHIQFVE